MAMSKEKRFYGALRAILAALAMLALPLAGAAHGDDTPAWIPAGAAEWAYYDADAKAPEGWTGADFDDSKWPRGKAMLGYGDADLATEISSGDDPNKKNLVAYFRRRFTIDDLGDVAKVVARVCCDDGAVVYVNGKEVCRENVPEDDGKVALASSSETRNERQRWVHLLEKGPFKVGENVIAVSVHQWAEISSDLAFDLELDPIAPDDIETVEKEVVAQEALRVAQEIQFGGEFIENGQSSFIDGDAPVYGARGASRTEKRDAVHDAEKAFPGARFVRAWAGDTVEKLAAWHEVDVEYLRVLNNLKKGHVFDKPAIVCLKWLHEVGRGETIEKIATHFETSAEILARLNGWKGTEASDLKQGQKIVAPIGFTYRPPTDRRPGELKIDAGSGNDLEFFGGARILRGNVVAPIELDDFVQDLQGAVEVVNGVVTVEGIDHGVVEVELGGERVEVDFGDDVIELGGLDDPDDEEADEPPPAPKVRSKDLFEQKADDVEFVTVAKGDTVASLAEKHEIDATKLRQQNALGEKDEIEDGEMLFLRFAVRPRAGKTIEDIARHFKVEVDAIRKLNGMKAKAEAKAGELLLVPVKTR